MNGKPGLLLVHGAWLGPWQWGRLEAELQNRGIRYATVSLPSCGTDPVALGSLVDDARAIEEGAAALGDEAIVVAHSYGGVPATQARFGPNVRRLVYLCAFMPDLGRSLLSYLPPDSLPPFVHMRQDGALGFVASMIPDVLCSSCDLAATDLVQEHIQLHSAAAVSTPVDSVAWRSIPSTYIVCTEDKAVPQDLQRMYAAQAEESLDLAADHMPMLSEPARLADMLAGIIAQQPKVSAQAV